MPLELQETALVEAAKRGSEEAFETIMKAYMPRALAFARRMNGDEADDVVQDAFIKAYKGLDGFKGDSAFGTWFFRVLSNVSLDHLRHRGLVNRIFFFSRREEEEGDEGPGIEDAPDPAPSSLPDAELMRKELGRELDAAIGKLPGRQRAVFLLKHAEGMKISEIASVLGISEGAVKSHLVRAVGSLREKLKGY